MKGLLYSLEVLERTRLEADRQVALSALEHYVANDLINYDVYLRLKDYVTLFKVEEE